MIAYLDANLVIYLVERITPWGSRVAQRIATLRAGGDGIAVSDLARTECLVGPFRSGNTIVLGDFQTFFRDPTVRVLPLGPDVYERAARIRAGRFLKPLDALHQAAAVEHGCGLFLTNDVQLARFPDISVEILS